MSETRTRDANLDKDSICDAVWVWLVDGPALAVAAEVLEEEADAEDGAGRRRRFMAGRGVALAVAPFVLAAEEDAVELDALIADAS